MNDPQTWTMVRGLTVGAGGGVGWVEEGKGGYGDNGNRITIKYFF